MSTFHFDIVSDGATTLEDIEAASTNAVVRQALLLISEIVRDRALSNGGEVSVKVTVRDAAGLTVWSGGASGGH